MSVTRTGRSIVMTALNDAVTTSLLLDSLALVGTGMTTGQRLTIKDGNGSSIIADHYVDGTEQDIEFIISSPKWVPGLKLTAVPAGGTFSVVARMR